MARPAHPRACGRGPGRDAPRHDPAVPDLLRGRLLRRARPRVVGFAAMANGTDTDSLGRLALFADLGRPQLEQIAHTLRRGDVRRRASASCARGSPARTSTSSSTARRGRDRRRRASLRLGRGEFFGEASALTRLRRRRPTSSRRPPLRCLVIPRDEVEPLPTRLPAGHRPDAEGRGCSGSPTTLAVAGIDRASRRATTRSSSSEAAPADSRRATASTRLGIEHAVDLAGRRAGRDVPLAARSSSGSSPGRSRTRPSSATTREYEWYDHNSLLADEPECRALVPPLMDRTLRRAVRGRRWRPAIAAFAERAALRVRYGCRWESHAARGRRLAHARDLGRRVPLPRRGLRARRDRAVEVGHPRRRGRAALRRDRASRARTRASASS